MMLVEGNKDDVGRGVQLAEHLVFLTSVSLPLCS